MPEHPQKIISLVPSLTELLIDLGLKHKLAGRTRFCIHPQGEVDDIPIVGGTKNPRLDKIRQLQPDYIIANREENRKEDVQKLRDEFRVNLTEIDTVEDALITIHELGRDLGAKQKAVSINNKIQQQLEQIPECPPLTVCYFIWRDPWMTAGGGTYINDVLKKWKLINVFEDRPRYPTIQLDELKSAYPDLILLSSEPYPFKEKHIGEIREACPGMRIQLTNGEWFSWYGSRMIPSFEALNRWRAQL